MNAKLIFTHALTPLHPGTGQGTGVIDLPIAREVATNLPYLPGSSLKGVLRDACSDPKTCAHLFGPRTKDIPEDTLHAGAAQFTDQRLLLLPVRSLAGTFAWVTSPFVLCRLQRECQAIGITDCPTAVPNPAFVNKVAHAAVTNLCQLKIQQKIVLEDIDLVPDEAETATQWAGWLGKQLFNQEWQTILSQKFCVVPDDIFSFLLETATEVIARNELTENKTSNNLWYEEALPAETVLSGLVIAQQVNKRDQNGEVDQGLTPAKVLEEVATLTKGMVQLGGNATVGRGLCQLSMSLNGGQNANATTTSG